MNNGREEMRVKSLRRRIAKIEKAVILSYMMNTSHFGGGEAGVVAQLDFARLRLLFELGFERGEAHSELLNYSQRSRK